MGNTAGLLITVGVVWHLFFGAVCVWFYKWLMC